MKIRATLSCVKHSIKFFDGGVSSQFVPQTQFKIIVSDRLEFVKEVVREEVKKHSLGLSEKDSAIFTLAGNIGDFPFVSVQIASIGQEVDFSDSLDGLFEDKIS